MAPASAAADAAANILQHISESTGGERARRAVAGALVLRAAEQRLNGAPGGSFMAARAVREVAALAGGAERSILQRLLLLLEECAGAPVEDVLAGSLVDYACELERTRRLPEADAALTLARCVAAKDAEIALHAGRVARKLGDHARALALYRTARELDCMGGAIGRLAAIGEAVVSTDPVRALSRAIRQARRAGDAEAAAVGLEERARLRRAAGNRRGAIRDLCLAAMRYPDPVDRSRAAHEVADVTTAAADLFGAREALLAALAFGDAPQRDHARSRLHTLSRDLGDQLGMRRWRSFKRPSLVSLSVSGRGPSASSAAPRLARWRESLERTLAPACG